MDWIDKNEELPEFDQLVLCSNQCEAEDFKILVLKFDGVNKFYDLNPPTTSGMMYNNGWYESSITHWMPLPNPPE